MVRPCTNGGGRKSPKGIRISSTYSHKKNVLDYIKEHDLDRAVDHFYDGLPPEVKKKKRKLARSWMRAEDTMFSACASGRGSHRNVRDPGLATVLNKESEQELVLWINSIRMDGAPVSCITRPSTPQNPGNQHATDACPRSHSWQAAKQHGFIVRLRRSLSSQMLATLAPGEAISVARQSPRRDAAAARGDEIR
ncbi:hypothetical protein GN244_ATG12155 [Phytophthora infestans]|uniref:HTH CENPB-type domain-containing protein n=1 Tax=Phytophthora infestans TaxID=4787 RepID=A0A833WB99_PHYIN|nr:hypothetical protein GN244_ATG12155 [Phytophthora infestans]KAF4141739.1 hypothetical protein GN958_ATG09069 [Phytophthora infestans]